VPTAALQGTLDAVQPSGSRAINPVPWRHQSAASRLIDRIDQGDREVSDTVRGLVAPIADRLRRKGRHSPARRETLIGIERSWRTDPALASESRLAFTSDFADKRRALALCDARLTSTAFSLARWPSAEPGLAILLIHFRVAPGTGVDLTTEVLSVVSRHAIGRRFERGDAAVIADFQRLAAELMTDARAMRCQCPSGSWIGEPALALGRPVLAIKTFLPAAYISWTT
jgi:hypothetical protein